MRKTIAVLALMLLCGQAWADVAVRTGSVTLANIRISALDDTAFIDFSVAGVLTQLVTSDSRYRIKITDSANKSIEGYPKAAGILETLGPELVTSIANVNYDTLTTTGNTVTYAGTTALKYAYMPDVFLSLYAAYKIVADLTATYYGFLLMYSGYGTSYGGSLINTATPNGTTTKYFTQALLTHNDLGIASNYSSYSGTYSVKKVLTPSATGVTIVSTRGGTTYRWTSQESGFNYNDPSGYTYTIYRETPYIFGALWNGIKSALSYVFCAQTSEAGLIHLASGSVARDSVKISAIADTAFLDLGAAINIAQYPSGSIVTVKDTTGKAITGFIGATGTGETYIDIISGNLRNGNFENGTTGVLAYKSDISVVEDERTGGSGSHSLNILATDTNGFAYLTAPIKIGRLYTYGGWMKNISSTKAPGISFGVLYTMSSLGAGWVYGERHVSGHRTASGQQYDLGPTLISVGAEQRYDDVFLRAIITPSATGVTIVSTQDGTTYSWASQESDFDYKGAGSYYSYTVHYPASYAMQNPTYQMPRFK